MWELVTLKIWKKFRLQSKISYIKLNFVSLVELLVFGESL